MSKKTNVKMGQSNKQISKEEIVRLRDGYESVYSKWLEVSNLTEEDLLEYRVVDKFKIEKVTLNGRIVVGMTYEDDKKEKQTIGEPIVLEHSSKEELLDAVFVLLFITKKLDSENEIAPVDGSHVGDYFNRKVREFAKEQGCV